MKKVELNYSLFEELPTPIIWDILSRLPVKACLSCKLVCKDWYHIIIDPYFADLRSSRRLYVTLWLHCQFDNRRHNFLLLDLDKSSQVDEMGNLNVDVDATIKFNSKLNTQHHKLFVTDECNGLVCLKKSRAIWGPYIICNLLTREQVLIEQSKDLTCFIKHYGLGCCPVSHQFKVLRILKLKNGKCVTTIQTVGSNEWRVIGDAPLGDAYYERARTVSLHGSLHWYSRKDNLIWSFHFGKEQFWQVPTPDNMEQKNRGRSLGVFDSCLYFSSTSKNLCEIWLMKEYGVKDSWVKQFVFQTENYTACMPLLQMGNGEILVSTRLYDSLNLGVCDTESGSCRQVMVRGVSNGQVMVGDARFSKLN